MTSKPEGVQEIFLRSKENGVESYIKPYINMTVNTGQFLQRGRRGRKDVVLQKNAENINNGVCDQRESFKEHLSKTNTCT